MNAQHIQELLNAYQRSSVTTEEKVFLSRCNDLLKQCPDTFWKRNNFSPGHITASAWVVNRERTHVLLIHHKSAQMWFQPGGHIESEDATLFDAVLREVKEETSHSGVIPNNALFDIDIHPIAARPERNEAAHEHFDLRILVEVPYETYTIEDDGILGVSWCLLGDVLSRNQTESLARMVRKTAVQ